MEPFVDLMYGDADELESVWVINFNDLVVALELCCKLFINFGLVVIEGINSGWIYYPISVNRLSRDIDRAINFTYDVPKES